MSQYLGLATALSTLVLSSAVLAMAVELVVDEWRDLFAVRKETTVLIAYPEFPEVKTRIAHQPSCNTTNVKCETITITDDSPQTQNE